MSFRRSPAFVALVAVALTATAARAGDPVAAQALFDQARDARAAGDWATACLRFEESQRLDPAAGTLAYLGECHEHLGHLATAWQRYREAADRLEPGDARAPVVQERIAALEPRLSHLTIVLAGHAPRDAVVRRDEVDLGGASLGVPLPVDPGAHVVTVRAAGRQESRRSVTLTEGATEIIAVDAGPPASLGAAPPPVPTARPQVEPADPARTRRDAGFALAGVGVVAAGVGAVTGAMTLARKDTVERLCPDGFCDDDAGLDAAAQGRTLSAVSTVAFTVAVVGLAAGVTLVATSPRRVSARASFGPGVAALSIQGAL